MNVIFLGLFSAIAVVKKKIPAKADREAEKSCEGFAFPHLFI